MKSENIERQNLAMIILSMTFIVISIIVILCNRVILDLWGGGIEYLVQYGFMNLLIIFIVVVTSILLNNAYLESKFYKIVIYQIFIGIGIGFGAILFSLILIDFIREFSSMQNLLSENLTISILIITTLLLVISVYCCLRFLTRIIYYLEFYILNKKISMIIKCASKEQIKNIHSTTQLERFYSILVIFVTIIWLNTDYDNIKIPEDPFVSLFATNMWVMMFSLSVYANYIVMFLLKNNTSLDDLK